LYPKYSDIYMTGIALATMVPVRILLVRYVFTPLGDRLLPSLQQRKTWTKLSRLDRVDRFGTVCFKLMFFGIISIIGYRILSDEDWFPTILGGHGQIRNVWLEFPNAPYSTELKIYYHVELAYHVQSLMFHLYMPWRNDFLEMALHHSTASFLVLFSYFNGFVRIGSIVLFVHDVGDVVGYSVKATVDTDYKRATISIYVLLLISWFFTRLFVFPFYILYTIMFDGTHMVPADSRNTFHYLEGMLYILQCLHIYWYCLFLIMGYVYSKTGQTVDIQQKAGDKYEKTGTEVVKVLETQQATTPSALSPPAVSSEDILRRRPHVK